MITAQRIDTLTTQQLRPAVRSLIAEVVGKSELAERHQREIAFEQAPIDQAHAQDGRAQAAEVCRQV